jgi:hypothetical protein
MPNVNRPKSPSKGKKLTLTSVNDKKVKPPKGTKTVTDSKRGLVYKDKFGKPIKKGR